MKSVEKQSSFQTRLINRLVQWILRSPFHGLISQSLLLITIHGRKSGKEYTIPVQYVRAGQSVTIVVGWPEQKTWWRNLAGGGPVRLLIGGHTFQGEAKVWSGKHEANLIAQALIPYLNRFPGAARSQHLYPAPDGKFHANDLQTAARDLVVVHVQIH